MIRTDVNEPQPTPSNSNIAIFDCRPSTDRRSLNQWVDSAIHLRCCHFRTKRMTSTLVLFIGIARWFASLKKTLTQTRRFDCMAKLQWTGVIFSITSVDDRKNFLGQHSMNNQSAFTQTTTKECFCGDRKSSKQMRFVRTVRLLRPSTVPFTDKPKRW